jgi:hypothetical protein
MLTPDEQSFLDFALSSLPRWMRDDDLHLVASAIVFGAVKIQTDYWYRQTLITQADGPVAGLPDWLNQHARDRGTNRQANESNAALRDRIRNVPDALTRASILSAADAILAAESIAGNAEMVELPRDGAVFGPYVASSGVGGSWAHGTGTAMIFSPTVKFTLPPYRDPSLKRRISSFRLDISSSADVTNDGNRAITGLSDDGAIVANAAGVAGADPTVVWKVRKLDHLGNIRDGFAKAYFSNTKAGGSTARYRYVSRRPVIVIILPFGSTTSTESSVREMLRQKKAAGFATLVERRLTPP